MPSKTPIAHSLCLLPRDVVTAALLLSLCVAGANARAAEETAKAAPPATEAAEATKGSVWPFEFGRLQERDRVLFLGDDHTQQMYHSRGVAAGLLGLKPELNLRFYNGGKNRATAADAVEWVDDLLDLSKPTAVVIWFGMNDMSGADGNIDKAIAGYQSDLAALIDHVAKYKTVRMISVMSPIVAILGADGAADADTLRKIAKATRSVAGDQKVGYIASREHFERIISGEIKGGTALLSLDGRHLTEEAHVIVASIVLRDIGAPAKDLARIGWSPLLPKDMAGVRPELALDLAVPDFGRAQLCNDLYVSMRRFDEKFFVLWRLSGRVRSAPPREIQAPQTDQAWSQVRRIAGEYRELK